MRMNYVYPSIARNNLRGTGHNNIFFVNEVPQKNNNIQSPYNVVEVI